jgi:hypothetical protein
MSLKSLCLQLGALGGAGNVRRWGLVITEEMP